MDKKITVITINLNNAEGLRRTIDSVSKQRYAKIEYIIIDGGSTDGSLNVIKEYSDKIDYWISEKDKGIYDAMNKAISISSGYYLNFLNSGDHYSNPLSLEMLINKSANEDIIYGNILVVEKDTYWIKKYPLRLNFKYFKIDTLPHPASLIKKVLFEKYGLYDTNLQVVADWKFFILSIIKNKASYAYLDKEIAHFYFDGISSNPKYKDLIQHERESTLIKYFPIRIRLMNLKYQIKNLFKFPSLKNNKQKK
jgi:glycosyltransferase involved in cell wall biosynthesis